MIQNVYKSYFDSPAAGCAWRLYTSLSTRCRTRRRARSARRSAVARAMLCRQLLTALRKRTVTLHLAARTLADRSLHCVALSIVHAAPRVSHASRSAHVMCAVHVHVHVGTPTPRSQHAGATGDARAAAAAAAAARPLGGHRRRGGHHTCRLACHASHRRRTRKGRAARGAARPPMATERESGAASRSAPLSSRRRRHGPAQRPRSRRAGSVGWTAAPTCCTWPPTPST